MTESTSIPTAARLLAARDVVRGNLDLASESVTHFAGQVAANPMDSVQHRNLGDAVEALRRRARLAAELEQQLAIAGYLDVTIAPAQDIEHVYLTRGDIDNVVLSVTWHAQDGWSYTANLRVDGDFEVVRVTGAKSTFCGRIPERDLLTVVANGRDMGMVRQASVEPAPELPPTIGDESEAQGENDYRYCQP